MVVNPNIWVLTDDRAGNVGQCLGVVEALDLSFERKNIAYNSLARLPNMFLGAKLWGISNQTRENIQAPWPDLVISAGRRTAPVARYIKKASGGKTKLVHIMDPGACGASDFDLICVPRHDDIILKSNQMLMVGAPHRVNDEKLRQALQEWQLRFAHLAQPRIGLIVGGATKNKTFSPEMARELGQTVNGLAEKMGASILVTTSRRTGQAAQSLLDEIKVASYSFKWGDEGENPYFGFLASSDFLIVTGDSVSMCSEACASGKPVYIYAPDGMVSEKHKRLHDSLYEEDYAQSFDGSLENKIGKKLNAAQDIASSIHNILSV